MISCSSQRANIWDEEMEDLIKNSEISFAKDGNRVYAIQHFKELTLDMCKDRERELLVMFDEMNNKIAEYDGNTLPADSEYVPAFSVLAHRLEENFAIYSNHQKSLHVLMGGDIIQRMREIRQNGMVPLYLPPYSPDLNPIEMMWSKMKAILRKWKIRNTNDLRTAIHRVLSLVFESDVLSWLSIFGYCC